MLLFIFTIASLAGVIYLYSSLVRLNNNLSKTSSDLLSLKSEQDQFKLNLDDALFEDHLKLVEKQKLQGNLNELETSFQKLQDVTDASNAGKVEKVYAAYNDFKVKLKKSSDAKLKTPDINVLSTGWGMLFMNKNMDGILTSINEENVKLDKDYQKYLASLPKDIATGGSIGSGYSVTKIKTDKGTFSVHLIKASGVKVKTLVAASDTCKDNCATKSLADYVKDGGGFAGMNGTYFCPPDYSTCGGKTNSFDFAMYDSNKKKWFNKNALTWFKTSITVFNDGHGKVYKKTSDFSGDASAAISNFPALVKDGETAIDDELVTSYQKQKGTKGAIGVNGDTIYLALISNASIYDAASVMKAIGAKNAMNLDGGGSSAMYINGKYVVGPGRSLPNAVVLTK